MQVLGELSVYEPRGQYQLVVKTVQAKGQGMLQARFEALKRRLYEEGLFDSEHKKPIPKFPRVVALVTSPTGAAIRLYLIAAGTILAAATSWTAPGSADGCHTAELVLHTDELTSAFEDEDTKSLPASIELHWYRTDRKSVV